MSTPLLYLKRTVQMLIYVLSLIRGRLLHTTVEKGWNTHVRNILHIWQVYFACPLRHIRSLENVLHFYLLVSGNKIITLTLSVKPTFFCVFLRSWLCVILILAFRHQRFHIGKLLLDLRQHLFADLKLHGAWVVLDRQGILREELY